MASTYTFLFTDLENSTRLWEQHPQEMKVALERHDTLLREAIESQSGQVVKSTGDGFMAVFSSAGEGLQAALEAQRSLYAEPWAETSSLRVRMGLHSGEAQVRSGDYYGPAVNRAARLMAAAHGGQILLSSTAVGLVGERLPDGSTLRDLGEHRLKDLERPEHVFQLVLDGLPSDFPPLNSLDLFPNNLPIQLTRFIGREQELADVQRLFAGTRLLTLTGPGGIGKTRLCLQAAASVFDAYPQGTWLVELSPLTDPQMVVQSVANVLSVRENSGRTLKEAVIDYIRYKSLLLVMDNCEHLIEACAHLADDLLRACPRLKILASSREALGIAGEVTYRVPSLSLPLTSKKPGSLSLVEVEQSEAMRLFVERAQAVSPMFLLEEENAFYIAQVCRRLDGIPLAIELAAARVRVLSPRQIAERLDDRFRLLTGGSRTALPRQQTLKALIDWSWDLLSEVEKILVRRLSVFAGSFTLDAAESVCGDLDTAGSALLSRENILDLLEGLVNKSLVQAGEDRINPRFRLLETIRQYAQDQLLAAVEASPVRDNHLMYYTRLAEEAEPHFRGKKQIEWLDRMERDQDNFRAALEWGLENCQPMGVRLAKSMIYYWVGRGLYSEGPKWLLASHDCLNHLSIEADQSNREEIDNQRKTTHAYLLAGASWMITGRGDTRAGAQLGEEAELWARASGDRRALSYALAAKALGQSFIPEYASQAEDAASEGLALARQVGDIWMQCMNLQISSAVGGRVLHDLDSVVHFQQDLTRLSHQIGNPWMLAMSLFGRLMVDIAQDRIEQARQDVEEGTRLFEQLKNRSFRTILASDFAHFLRRRGELDEAQVIYKETLPQWLELGQQAAVTHQIECLAALAVAHRQFDRAARLLGAAKALRIRLQAEMAPEEISDYEATLAALRLGSEPEEIQSAWAEGEAMTIEEAVAYALEKSAK